MIRASSLAVLVVAFSASAAPVVTAIYPQSGPIGAQVAVSGTGFTGVTAVAFNGTAASGISVQNDNLIYAYAPAAATAGMITVTHPTTGTGASGATYTPIAAPATTTAVPATGSRGTAVTLTGTGYVNVSQVTFNGVAAAFTVVGPTQITTSVPPGATTGLLRVFTPGGTASTNFTVVGAAAPAISSFTPATGAPFTQVTVTGTDFTGTTGATVGGTAASFSVVSDKEVRVNVPGAAPSGTITVTNSIGTATSAGMFTVIPNPVITSFLPASGAAGTQVTITGTGFVNVTQVRLGTLNAAYTVMGPTQIVATVPSGAASSTWRVSTSATTAFSAGTFTVLSAAAPTITGFSPASGGQFTQVAIFGTNFTGAIVARFNALAASVTVVSDTELRTSVPSGATTGPLQVQNSIGTATSSTNFTVLPPPTVTGFLPTTGTVGTVVTVNGTNFTGVSSVSVGGYSQPFVVVSPTQLTVTLSGTARTGSVVVNTPTGGASGPGTFTVTVAGPPTITAFSPGSGGWFSQVTIDGTNLMGVTAVQFAGSTSTLVSPSTDTRLFAYVPNGAVTGPITVFNALGSAVSTQPFTVIPPPTLSGFSPASGGQGSAVVLTGTNFTGASSVAIGNTAAGFTVDSATQITATVPPGAQTGTIRVQTPGGAATSLTTFSVISAGMPVISGFAPAFGQPFTSVSISGSNLTGVQAVLFNGVAGSLQSGGSDTLVRASVPSSGATTGPITVVNSLGSVVSTAVFTVLTPPTVSAFAPATGAVGTAVTITGTAFTGTTSVGFNGVSAPFTVTSPTQIATTVPPGATTGAISVSGINGSVSSAAQFTVTSSGAPTVTGFTPGSGGATALLTLTGTNFTGTTAVTVGGQPVSFFSVSNDVRLFIQPATGSTGGVITVTNPSGSGSSGSPYVVLPAPTVTSFTPTSGALGAAVTITGTNFTGATTVRFNNTSAGFVVNSPTSITATVPAGSNGPIQVFGPGGTGTSATPFTINPAGAPTITGFSPSAGGPFSGLSVTGTNFTGVTDVKLAGRSLGFSVNSDLNLSASLPSDPMTGMLTVTNAMGSATSVGIFTALAAPTVTAIAPNTGGAGTSVTITGTGFTGATQVTFGGVAALFTPVSATQVTASVPVGALTGAVRVTTPAGSASSTQFFTVTSAAMPAITGFLPASGPTGTQVTLTGTGFAGTSVVRFNGLNASFSVLSDTLLLATVPAQATTGTITVINAQGPATSASAFTVQPLPAVTSISPFTGPVGTAVTVRGTDFTGAGLVSFNGTPAAFMVVSPTEITATVPAGSTTGRISVATPVGTGFSSSNFVVVGVLPTISSFTPASGGAGTTVLVSGTGFSGAQWATVGGVEPNVSVLNDLLVAVNVPSGAATGPIRIATSAGVATSATNFTVVPPPVITGVSPASGAAATAVTLTGSGFTGATAVTFGGATAAFTVAGDSSITATVPIAAATGTIRVTTPGGAATSTVQFGILSAAAPTVTAFTPTSGGPGTTVTVTGTDFGGTTAVMLSGVLGGFTVQSATQLTFTVPSGAASGVLRVVNAAGAGQSTASFTVVPAPFISSVSPAAGTQGTTVTINGGNFNGATQVLFGTVPAAFTVVSATQLTATVPAGAVTSSLRVVTPGGTAFGSTFVVLGVSVPAVTGFTPTMGGVSTAVTVTGARFTGATAVRFNGIPATFQLVSDTSLTATVPTGATTGPVSVTNSMGTGTSAAPFMVGPVPQIAGFTPGSGTAGTVVTIVGNLFTGATAVQFNGKDAVFTVTGATLITATVPMGATSGRVTVVTPAGSGTSPGSFTVLSSAPPTVTSFTPATGQAGTDVTVVGTNFTGVFGVTFNGATASFTVAADTGLVATVPVGATTGPIAVRNSLGTATSATNFTVAIPPAVTSFTPAMGNPGDTVTVTGLGFTGATGVKFNGVTASFTVQSNTALTATVPAGTTTGPLSVTGPTGTGTSAMDFTILNPSAPTVTAVVPAVGSTAGGTMVTITGLAFATGATVKFGATPATTVTFTDATTLVAMTPAAAAGAVTVEVTNPDAQKGSLANAFTYVTPGADGGIGGGAGGGGGSGGTGGGAGGGMGKGGCGCSTGGPGLILLGLLAFARRRRARPL